VEVNGNGSFVKDLTIGEMVCSIDCGKKAVLKS
jgi:hypothetical protein